MRSIRLFLWTLVAAMMMQGFLHADEYGTAATLMGGMTLTFSVWGESMKSLLLFRSNGAGLPRALVTAALQESARHPGGLGHIPRLRQALQDQQRVWATFREQEVEWMLRHADVVGGLTTAPAGRLLWTPAFDALATANRRLDTASAGRCTVTVIPGCTEAEEEWAAATSAQAAAATVVEGWRPVLRMELPTDGVRRWLQVVNLTGVAAITNSIAKYEMLYDIASTRDVRLTAVRAGHRDFVYSAVQDTWARRLIDSLLEGELWFACLEHIRAREGRVRELMVGAGVQELFQTHERILNASLRTVATAEQQQIVYDWFGEMLGYAWWMSEDMPAIVRRCVGQDGGDCVRIGPTEVAALRSQADERARIVDDWSRRVLIGMWNALPGLALLILLEMLVLCLDRRLPFVQQPPHEIVLKLDGPQRRVKRLTDGG